MASVWRLRLSPPSPLLLSLQDELDALGLVAHQATDGVIEVLHSLQQGGQLSEGATSCTCALATAAAAGGFCIRVGLE